MGACARLGRGSSCVLVADRWAPARLIVERRVDGNDHYAETSLDLDSPPPITDGLLMRFTKHG